ncbi:hypothetical protein A4U88_5220 [Serratia marcescens]|nr:hypothetical protein A4U88_5220 [Serratia marcescens]
MLFLHAHNTAILTFNGAEDKPRLIDIFSFYTEKYRYVEGKLTGLHNNRK